jgi:hypothetical protein
VQSDLNLSWLSVPLLYTLCTETVSQLESVVQMPAEIDREDDTCASQFDKCGGKGFNTSIACCDPDAMCVVKNM